MEKTRGPEQSHEWPMIQGHCEKGVREKTCAGYRNEKKHPMPLFDALPRVVGEKKKVKSSTHEAAYCCCFHLGTQRPPLGLASSGLAAGGAEP